MSIHKKGFSSPPSVPEGGQSNLPYYWDKEVSELFTVESSLAQSPIVERHRFGCLLTMALISRFWNGNKFGDGGEYPWRKKQLDSRGVYRGGTYLGHNIGAVAIDGYGKVIDFDFNHNNIFWSSVEHAEARLLKRAFSLVDGRLDISQSARSSVPITGTAEIGQDYASRLNYTTIYTSLESCAQCSGIMTLGSVGGVVYLQPDPGQHMIGNALYNLTRPLGRQSAPIKYGAPVPINGNQIIPNFAGALDAEYRKFAASVVNPSNPPFYVDSETGVEDRSPSTTSFLCTDVAEEIFAAGLKEFMTTKAEYPEFKPDIDGLNADEILNNKQMLDGCHRFFSYAAKEGRRGTPHK